MNLKRLEVFLAVVDCGSFSKAARAVHVTQSTVSQHIASLEELLGSKLLDRTPRGILPTESGKILLRHARKIVAETREIPRAMKRLAGLEDAVLTIGASNIPGNYVIPEAIPSFLARYPRVSITVIQGDSRETVERIKQERVEIGIVGTRYADKDLLFTPLGREVLMLAAGGEYGSARGKPITMDELAKLPYVAREPGSGTQKTVQDALIRAGAEPLNVRICLGSNEAVKRAVVNGIGVSFISETAIRGEIESGELFALSVKGLDLSRSFHIVSRLRRELSPQAAAFKNMLLELHRRRRPRR
ncbi:MAG: LysR family transcriptional regulator [Deltaproteobacteria bacterium]|nr:LysR family transcriptional regulator [Deltaproteobacteria bacterium]